MIHRWGQLAVKLLLLGREYAEYKAVLPQGVDLPATWADDAAVAQLQSPYLIARVGVRPQAQGGGCQAQARGVSGSGLVGSRFVVAQAGISGRAWDQWGRLT